MKKYIIIGVSLIVCSLIIGTSFLLVQIAKQSSIEEQKRTERLLETYQKNIVEEELDTCLSDASWSYHFRWNESCKTSGIDKKTEGCLLPTYLANTMDVFLQELKDNCFKRYK